MTVKSFITLGSGVNAIKLLFISDANARLAWLDQYGSADKLWPYSQTLDLAKNTEEGQTL